MGPIGSHCVRPGVESCSQFDTRNDDERGRRDRAADRPASPRQPRALSPAALNGRRAADRRRLFADRARRHRAHDRVRAGRCWSALRSTSPMWCRSMASSGTTSRAIVGDRRAGDARVPGRRHLPGAGLPRLREAVFPARLRLVGGVPDRHRRRRSSPRPATSSRASGSARFYVVGLVALIGFRRALFLHGAALDARRAASTAAPSSSAAASAARR